MSEQQLQIQYWIKVAEIKQLLKQREFVQQQIDEAESKMFEIERKMKDLKLENNEMDSSQ